MFTFYAHLCQMFKSINKIGGYIKVSRYTKIHLALKKFQPPWTHKAIQAWMHPFWLKKISSVLCWGTGTGCAKPIFDTQIISNRKYSNPLFPLTMLWFWETETQWWKEQVCSPQFKSVADCRQCCCLWTLVAGEHLRTQATIITQVHTGGSRGGSGFGSKPAETNGAIPSGSRPFWTGLFKGSRYERLFTGRRSEPALGCTSCALNAPPSLVVCGDPHLANYPHCRKEGKEGL